VYITVSPKKSLTTSYRQFIYCLKGDVKKKMGTTTKHTQKAKALRRCQERYEALKSQVGDLGYVMQGSVVRRTKRCGHLGCQCHLGPEYEHGPYYQWTRKIQAKTVTRILNPKEARLYKGFIRNGRRLRKLVSSMNEISAQAAGYLADEKTKE
jgi:hypothetical protein